MGPQSLHASLVATSTPEVELLFERSSRPLALPYRNDEDPTGLLNEGFRYRDLETGTFITRDPLGFVDGPNMYAYVVQNPWTKFDPAGLQKNKDNNNPKISRRELEKFERKLNRANEVAESARQNNEQVKTETERLGSVEITGSKEFIEATKYGIELLGKVGDGVGDMVNSLTSGTGDITHTIDQGVPGTQNYGPDSLGGMSWTRPYILDPFKGFPTGSNMSWNTNQHATPEQNLATLGHEFQHASDYGKGAPAAWYEGSGGNAPIVEQRGMRTGAQVLQAAGWSPDQIPNNHISGHVPNITIPVNQSVPPPITDKNISSSERVKMLRQMENQRIQNQYGK
jgi:RHS repeat-associated protein